MIMTSTARELSVMVTDNDDENDKRIDNNDGVGVFFPYKLSVSTLDKLYGRKYGYWNLWIANAVDNIMNNLCPRRLSTMARRV